MRDAFMRGNTDTYFGRGTVARVGELIKERGGHKVLIHHVSEPFIMPLVNEVIGHLEDAGLEWVDLGGVVPNPRMELVYEGIDLCKKEGVDYILAIGGGSSIDSAKTIGIGVLYDGDVWELLDTEGAGKTWECLPIGVISTTAATGSELTAAIVVNKGDKKRQLLDPPYRIRMRPKFVILDPELTFTAPRFQTAAGTADIVSHLLENYFTADEDNDFAFHFLEAGLKTAIKFGPVVLEEPKNYEARGALMVLAGYCINGFMKFGISGDWNNHALEHAMGGTWNIAHGAGLAVTTPRWMRYVYKDHMDLFLQYATAVWGIPYKADDPEKTALAGIEATEDLFFNKLGLPSNLHELGLSDEDMTDEILHKICKDVFYMGGESLGRFAPLKEEDFFNILSACR